jgi:uncharacterized protein DUF3850
MTEPTTHYVKSWPEFYTAIKLELKTFDLRKDDRNYQPGDFIVFEEFRPGDGEGYTGNKSNPRRIIYILREFEGLMPGYCVLGLTP